MIRRFLLFYQLDGCRMVTAKSRTSSEFWMPKAFHNKISKSQIFINFWFLSNATYFEFDAQPLSFSVCEINGKFWSSILDFKIAKTKSRENTMVQPIFDNFDLTRKMWWTKFNGQDNFTKLKNWSFLLRFAILSIFCLEWFVLRSFSPWFST